MCTSETRENLSVLVLVHLINIHMTPTSYDFRGMSVEQENLVCAHKRAISRFCPLLLTIWICIYVYNSLILFPLIFSEPTFFIVEGPCSEQSEPLLQGEPMHGPVGTHHQPTWTMKFLQQKSVKGLLSAQGWAHYHPEIKFQSTAEVKKRPCCLHGMYEKVKKKPGWWWISTSTCLELRLSVLAT